MINISIASEALLAKANTLPWFITPNAFQERGTLFFGQSYNLFGLAQLPRRNCRRGCMVLSARSKAYINVPAWSISRASLSACF